MTMKMNNYEDKNSLELLFIDIEKCLESKSYLSALTVALIIPDMLGKLAYPNLEKVTDRYIQWFDDNVRNLTFGYLYSQNPLDMDSDSPKMNGQVCYALRCKLFHEGTNDIESKTTARINEFVLSFTDENDVMGDYAGREYEIEKRNLATGKTPETNYLYISCKGLCKEILEAAKLFYKNNPNLDYPKLRINNGGGKISKDWFI